MHFLHGEEAGGRPAQDPELSDLPVCPDLKITQSTFIKDCTILETAPSTRGCG